MTEVLNKPEQKVMPVLRIMDHHPDFGGLAPLITDEGSN